MLQVSINPGSTLESRLLALFYWQKTEAYGLVPGKECLRLTWPGWSKLRAKFEASSDLKLFPLWQGLPIQGQQST